MSGTALERLTEQLLVGWREFPRQAELEALLAPALARAADAEPQIMTISTPVSRPGRLRLAPLTERADLDSFYHGEGAELCVSADGQLYLVYRRTDGGDYCVLWSSATSLPESLVRNLPDVLAHAMLDVDA